MTSSEPVVSVVIPVFNASDYVADAISSVLNQTYPHLECIVVDDGSNDSTEKVARTFGASIKYLRQANQGVASARNTGARASTGSFLAFLDADDVWLARKIERQIATMVPVDAAMSYTGITIADSSLRGMRDIPAPDEDDALKNTLLLQPPVISVAQSALIKRDAFFAVGGFDERLSTSADTDLALRIGARYRIAAVKEPLVLYRQHGAQMHSDPLAMKRDMLIVYRRVFSDEALDAAIRDLRRTAYGNLYSTVAAACFRRSAVPSAVWHALCALRWKPQSLLSLIFGGRN